MRWTGCPLAFLGLLLAGRIAAQTPATPPPSNAPPGMVWVPGGEFWMGSDTPEFRDARPWHRVHVDGFWMDATEVTNEQFEKFVAATKYVTVAERAPTREEFPTVPPENLVAGSVVFSPPAAAVPLGNYLQWWNYVKGANWRHPNGPGSDLKGKEKHPCPHRIRRRVGLLSVGRQTVADRSRV
jgi:formylglycine-generating enzyme required for sulfatase activity